MNLVLPLRAGGFATGRSTRRQPDDTDPTLCVMQAALKATGHAVMHWACFQNVFAVDLIGTACWARKSPTQQRPWTSFPRVSPHQMASFLNSGVRTVVRVRMRRQPPLDEQRLVEAWPYPSRPGTASPTSQQARQGGCG